MKRFITLALALGLLMLAPLAPAAAQDERIQSVVIAQEASVGVAADGALLTTGTFELYVGGVVVETGTVDGRYYDRGDGTGVHGTRHFVDASTGNELDTQVKALVVDVDDTGTVVTYVFQETIVSSGNGATGRGHGVGVVTLFDDGSFLLDTSADFIVAIPI
jgi:hypothetical protein